MQRTFLLLFVVVASPGLLACDRSRERPAASRDSATAPRPGTTAAYTLLHVVGNEAGSEWTADTTGRSGAATAMAEGDTAYFAQPADPMRDWQLARVKRIGAVRWVHPSDFFAP